MKPLHVHAMVSMHFQQFEKSITSPCATESYQCLAHTKQIKVECSDARINFDGSFDDTITLMACSGARADE